MIYIATILLVYVIVLTTWHLAKSTAPKNMIIKFDTPKLIEQLDITIKEGEFK